MKNKHVSVFFKHKENEKEIFSFIVIKRLL